VAKLNLTGGRMPEKLVFDKASTALLILDYQNDVLADIPVQIREPLIRNAVKILDLARYTGLEVIHIANVFRKGYPEINSRNRIFSQVKARGMYKEGGKGASISSKVSPLKNEILITKHRSSAFHGTDLETILRVKGITRLVMIGVATEGCVLSTLRQAVDLDYSAIIISDGCADPEQEVHDALIQKIFPREATVITTHEFVRALKDVS
jgi:nicotinamidase-related amidase